MMATAKSSDKAEVNKIIDVGVKVDFTLKSKKQPHNPLTKTQHMDTIDNNFTWPNPIKKELSHIEVYERRAKGNINQMDWLTHAIMLLLFANKIPS